MAVIEVVYVPAEAAAWHTTHDFKAGMTVSDALLLSGVFVRYPDAAVLPIGIFSKRVTKNQALQAGDRVELYRALSCDPKEKRRNRVKKPVS
jgi:putative ubiquitin-RnfH superfamily antitoxin RatB of RatAB toxin-antitoxin module